MKSLLNVLNVDQKTTTVITFDQAKEILQKRTVCVQIAKQNLME